jgi:hypothetical protein
LWILFDLRTNKLQKLSKVAYENNEKRLDSVYSKRIRAGKRRTYFFDVRATRGNDYYITITESRKKFNEDGYDRHKIFLYKEDFNKFLKALTEAVDFVKTDLMPDFDFDAFNHDQIAEEGASEQETEEALPEVAIAVGTGSIPVIPATPTINDSEEVDKW